MMRSKLSDHTVMIALRKAACWSIAHPFAAILLYLAFVSVFFLIFPRFDIWVSGLFYSDEHGFWAQHSPFLQKVRHLGPYLVRIIAIACVAILLVKLLVPGLRPIVPLRQPIFLLSTLILGPGILVNAILKDTWGRPRPRSVEEFGGELPFQPVWKMTDYCDRNCSFVSGEGSAGMWLVAMVFLLPATWRKAYLWFVLPLGLILSVNRVAFGGHFLSDTMISWGLTLLVVLSVYWVLYLRRPRLVTDRKLDEWFTIKGRKLERFFKKTSITLRRKSRESGLSEKFEELAANFRK